MIPQGLIGAPGQTVPDNTAPDPLTQALFQNRLLLQQGQQAGQYGTQQAKIAAGGQVGAAQQGAQATEQGNVLQYQLGQQQLGQRQQGINALLSYLPSGGAGGGGNSGIALGGGAGAAGGGGAVGNYGYGTAQAPAGGGGGGGGGLAPAISHGQEQANINLNNAQNWAQAGGESRRQTQQLAGGGLGATSPLAKALQAQIFGGALAANQAGATNYQNEAAKLNAQQALGGYQADVGAAASEYGSRAAAQASQYGSALDYQAALAQIQASKQNAILAALGNFAG